MEFVIVAPLYFLLLGGMFMGGDLILNRGRMHVGDQLATWVGASRFCPRVGKAKDREKVDGLVQELFDRAIGGIVPHGDDDGFDSDWFDVLEDNNAMKVNGFMGLFYGGILRLPIKVPSWVRGMMGLQGVMVGKGSKEVLLMETATFNCGDYRSYSFHRLPMHGLDYMVSMDDMVSMDGTDLLASRSKHIAAEDIVNRGQLANVIRERWLNNPHDEMSDRERLKDLQPAVHLPKKRFTGEYGE